MTKQEWQNYHQLTDPELSFITQIIKETNGQIVSVIITPKRDDGSIIPFNERK